MQSSQSRPEALAAGGQVSDGSPEPPPLDPARHALFLDVDGTLAEICPEPSQVAVPPATVAALAALQRALDGALAILSGRSGAAIDLLLQPLRLPYGANHGAEFRRADGQARRLEPSAALPGIVAALRQRAAGWPGVLVESKPLGVAVHYRMAPPRERDVHDLVHEVAAAHDGQFDVLTGKMVYELKPHGVDKGRALREFMRAAPFAGRVPVMAGDDLTDESAFAAAQEAGGFGIKIGPGDSIAPWRLSGPPELARWLQALRAKAGAIQ
ncbi:trehalose-phosphatase [Bordetella genomosp. 13]|uniref:Trehalose 6-phosphate phosphatase n=1 Tax=Bordetella genomosp. 13 TaxID=463040 RepID=A0A1W6ZDP6_9BORD|nr:trehalose-phosphatase [Bordetella genomosp. 13]ARP94974.1 trehalose-phosphatase [Bordetella genomosp. 13]